MFELTKIAAETYVTADGKFRVEKVHGYWVASQLRGDTWHVLFEAETEVECVGLLRDYIS